VSIEAVILVPLFLFAVFITLEGALWVNASATAMAAAQDGARAGTYYRGGGPAEGVETAEEIIWARAVGTNWQVDADISPQGLTITVTGQSLSVIPGLDFPVTKSATMPWETL
jgi:hypothetical protein